MPNTYKLNNKDWLKTPVKYKRLEEDVCIVEMSEINNVESGNYLDLIVESLNKRIEKFRTKGKLIAEIETLEQDIKKIETEKEDLFKYYKKVLAIKENGQKEIEKLEKKYNVLETKYKLENAATQLEYDEIQESYVEPYLEEMEVDDLEL